MKKTAIIAIALVAIMILVACSSNQTPAVSSTVVSESSQAETTSPTVNNETDDWSAYSKFNGTWRRELSVGYWQYVIDIGKKSYTVMQIGKDYSDKLGTYALKAYDENRLESGGVIFELTDDDTLVSYSSNNTSKKDTYHRYADGTTVNTYDHTDNTPSSSATIGEKNSLSSAKQYLSITAFSYKGLVEQLEYEGYTHSEAVYGADNCGADWNEQAAKSAKQYLSMTAFSRSGLIEQLEYEGFTHDQAVYGVEQNGY